MLHLLVATNVVPSSLILTLMMEAIPSSKTAVPTRATLRNIPEDGILYSHRRENLKSYKYVLSGYAIQRKYFQQTLVLKSQFYEYDIICKI
jgi:hypothetical protein